jgi:hypothetical protein
MLRCRIVGNCITATLLLMGVSPSARPLLGQESSVLPLRVDLNPATDRKDILTKSTDNWNVPDGPEATKTFGTITVTLRRAGTVGSGLTANWWKRGYDTDATMASDGVFVKDGARGGQIGMVIRGLPPGRHGITTFHNGLEEGAISRYNLLVNGVVKARGVQPSVRATNDYDAGSGYVEVEARAGEEIVIGIQPDGSGAFDNVVLNGFEIGASDPARRAIKPIPAHNDEHAVENPTLTWTPPRTGTAHHVYLGTDPVAVANATLRSPEFKGKQTDARFPTSGLNSSDSYYWRVDEIGADGKEVTRGDVWRFRVRHLAFPGAEGYGRFARGGRGGRVIEVTNLEDSGPGSLRAAVEAEGPRTVVFRVGGTIQLKDKLVIRNPYLTIAGQTAPGDGICVRGATFGNLGTHDTIIRYVRVRVGDESGKTYDGMGFASSDHCIIDHCSISWTIDEAVSSRGARNVTFQRNLIAEALNMSVHSHYTGTGKGHSFAGSISGNIGSFHHNLLANCAGRNWSLAGGLTQGGRMAGYLDIRNNVVYNWEHRTNDGGVKALNLVNNYYIPGPATRVFHLLKPDTGNPGDPQQYFVLGNLMEGRPQYDSDNWKNGCVIFDNRLDLNTSPQVRLDEPFCEPFVTTQPARDAYESVMADVGCNYPKYDAVDERLIRDVRRRGFTYKGSKTGTPGIIDSQKDVGGWPELKSGAPPPDRDHDGIPDVWETAHRLNPTDPTDARRDSGDGYTYLEKYLNAIVPESRSLSPDRIARH